MRNPDPACPACGTRLPDGREAVAALAGCPQCGREIAVAVFPAFGRGPLVGARPESTTSDEEAACFFHPAKRAVVPCDRCGRFLCALCDLPIAGQHLCPECVQATHKKEGFAGVGRPRIRWDSVVWYLALLPVILCYFVVPVTALAAFGLGFWGLRAPPSRVANSRARIIAGMAVALLLAGGGIAVWTALFG